MDKTVRKQELLHYKVGHPYPSFISVKVDANQGDYLFTYSDDMYCRGAYPYMANPSFCIGYGDDTLEEGKQGFEYMEDINIGIYDAQQDKFFKLNCTEVDDKSLKYQSLGLFRVTADVGEEIFLNVNEALAEEKIVVKFDKDVINVEGNGTYYAYFSVQAQNVENFMEMIDGNSGEPRRIYHSVNGNLYYAKYRYEIGKEDRVIGVNVIGTSMFDNSLIVGNDFVTITREGTTPPPPSEPRTLYEDSEFKVTGEPSNFGEMVYVENKSEGSLVYVFTFEKKDGGYVGNSNSRRPLAPGGKVRALITQDKYSKLYVNRVSIDGVVTQINKTIEL